LYGGWRLVMRVDNSAKYFVYIYVHRRDWLRMRLIKAAITEPQGLTCSCGPVSIYHEAFETTHNYSSGMQFILLTTIDY